MGMRNWRPLAALVVMIGLAMLPATGGLKAGQLNLKEYRLFDGTNVADSTARTSFWIPIRGATRVYFRTWSAGAAADTDFCDTVSTWVTLFSDSVGFIARDSAGTIVTASNRIPKTAAHGEPFPMCVDSLAISGRSADSTSKMVIVINPVEGVAKPLRGSQSAHGRWSMVVPNPAFVSGPNFPLGSAANALQGPEVFMVGYMRVRITPTTRLTTAGFSSTAGLRTRGFNKLRVYAYVLYPNN